MNTRYLFLVMFFFSFITKGNTQDPFTVKNSRIELSVDKTGNLVSLKNLQTGQNYASGRTLWRLYFDTQKEKGIQVTGKDNRPAIRQEGAVIFIDYASLKTANSSVNMKLSLKISLEEEQVRFSSEISNNEPKTIVREIQYPLVGNCQIPDDHKLLVTRLGGQLYPHPVDLINREGNNPPYMAPAQFFRQMDMKYPSTVTSNCFAFTGESQGLYFGCHDNTFQNTWHGLRVYPDSNGKFTELEAGIFKYPQCESGNSWKCEANVVSPYSGSWHQTSKLYRKWADTWWEKEEPPMWVKKMKSWQRIIFRHQYGETFFRYSDLGDRIKKAGESVGELTVFPFGWWDAGMDNGYPDSYFVTDPDQGGDEAWKKAIADYRNGGGRILLYFNGKLIDTESNFYRKGTGNMVCYKSNTGTNYTEAYLFKAHDTFTGSFNSRNFVIADAQNPVWQKMLLNFADRAMFFGADAVFYDQLGYMYSGMNWDISGEFPVLNRNGILDRAVMLKMIREHIKSKGSQMALGTEGVTDVTGQYADFLHTLPIGLGPNTFIEWVRYTFPELIISDREIRDDTEIEWRVNHTVLRGLRNDIEIYRCRDLIDKTPNYQQYLGRINAIKEKYSDLLLTGTYRDTEGFSLKGSPAVTASCFVNENRLAVVMTTRSEKSASTQVSVPGYRYKEFSGAGVFRVAPVPGNKTNVSMDKDALVVVIYEKL